jgi:hypothetical protein
MTTKEREAADKILETIVTAKGVDAISQASAYRFLMEGAKQRSELTPEDGPITAEDLAAILYEDYCEAVGGKDFSGDALPDWATFQADPKKKKQSDAWIKVAETARQMLVGL